MTCCALGIQAKPPPAKGAVRNNEVVAAAHQVKLRYVCIWTATGHRNTLDNPGQLARKPSRIIAERVPAGLRNRFSEKATCSTIVFQAAGV